MVKQAGLGDIEWGGDVHVPHGDSATARDVGRVTRAAGLRVLAYSSYYCCRDQEPFEPVLETAMTLGAPLIRIWAGQLGSAEADVAYRPMVIEQSRRAVALAAQHGIVLAYEFHSNTLTDTKDSALALLHLGGFLDNSVIRLKPRPPASCRQVFDRRLGLKPGCAATLGSDISERG